MAGLLTVVKSISIHKYDIGPTMCSMFEHHLIYAILKRLQMFVLIILEEVSYHMFFQKLKHKVKELSLIMGPNCGIVYY